MPLQETSGNVTTDAYGGGVAAVPNYIEDVFSTYLYTGNGSTQTITNGIDLSTKGGLVWAKRRDAAINNGLWSTTSAGNFLISNATTGNTALATGVTAFSTTGFSLGSGYFNTNAGTYVSWSFKQQAKFFTQVTYTGTGSTRTIAHDLGSTPAFIIVKRTDTASNWACYHTSLGATQNIALNATAAAAASSYWNNTSPTSTVFSVDGSSDVNASGGTYIAYLFAHNAGGFGLTGTDNVISCGSFTTDGSGNATVNLGYEPQWVLIKRTDGVQNWLLNDVMRGMSLGQTSSNVLFPNLSNAEYTAWAASPVLPNATGFVANGSGSGGFSASANFIYIAIRRGPMKVPTSGTSVFSPNAYAGTSSAQTQTTNFPVDLFINKTRNAASDNFAMDRLRGSTQEVETNTTAAESALSNIGFDSNTGVKFLGSQLNGSGSNFILWSFRRAPSFFDEVCYTGTGSAQTLTHNLGVAPELMIIKSRLYSGSDWAVYAGDPNQYLRLNTTNASAGASNTWNYLSPTSTQFSVGNSTLVGASGWTYVAYLFATCAGVSKVGSYTGNGTTQTINCGFTGGARFVLIKRTDSTGNWYVYDTARGMTTLVDPYLLLNSTAAESATLGSVTTVTTGFAVDASILAAVNTNAASYIFLAIA